jgi:hypothetical protein
MAIIRWKRHKLAYPWTRSRYAPREKQVREECQYVCICANMIGDLDVQPDYMLQ